MGSATVQGQLWGALATDWAAYGEQIGLPLQGAALDAAHVTARTRLLDAGCGAGLLVLLAYLRGAQVTALDAASTLLAVVREREPAADVREGDLEALPFADASFDAVTAVNCIFLDDGLAPPPPTTSASVTRTDPPPLPRRVTYDDVFTVNRRFR